jgi:peptide/nickel transport system permease protein
MTAVRADKSETLNPDQASTAPGKLAFFWATLRAHPEFALGYAIVAVVVAAAVFAPLIAPYSPITADPGRNLLPPSWAHPMGTDATGMDIFSRVIYAPRVDITIALISTFISALVGATIGALVGYYENAGFWPGLACDAVMRVADVLQAFPVFIFAIALVAILGQSVLTIIFAITFVNVPTYIRLLRGQAISVRRMRYVEAAIVAGLPDREIIRRHVIPNSMAPVLAQLSVNIGFAILLIAALSFVGAGVRAPTPEWGSMIAMGFQNVITGQWWPSVFPGLALAVTVFGFSLIGASVEFLFDPARRATLSVKKGGAK